MTKSLINISKKRILMMCLLRNNSLFFLKNFDKFLVSKGHILIITKRHAETFFDITDEEQIAIIELLNKCKKYIDKKYNPDGYNVGLNCGESAGPSVMHLIPRYKGDVENLRGGVRGVISNKKIIKEN